MNKGQELVQQANKLYESIQDITFSMSVRSSRPDLYTLEEIESLAERLREQTEHRIDNYIALWKYYDAGLRR